jgi:hypothetical protein
MKILEIIYSGHSKKRASLRFISHEEVVECLKNGICFKSKQDVTAITCEYEKTKIVFRIDMEQDILVVITVIPSNKFDKEIKKLAKKNKISARQAIKILKGVA